MALAIVEYDGTEDGRAHFGVDIGANRYYAYAIGDRKTADRVGDFVVMRDTTARSRLIGPVPDSARGRVVLTVPADAFDNDHRDVQIASFREESLQGPAYSDIVRVPRGGAMTDALPELSFGLSGPGIRVVPHRGIKERPLSTSMFWGALVSLLPSIIPAIAPLISNLIGGLAGGAQPAAPAGAPAGAPATTTTPPATGSAPIAIPGLSGGGGGGAVGGGILQQILSPQNVAVIGDVLKALIAATPMPKPVTATVPADDTAALLAGAESLGLSTAAGFPAAALAAQPAAVALLREAMTPETVRTLVRTDDPSRLFAAVAQAIADCTAGLPRGTDRAIPRLATPAPRGLGLGVAASVLAAEPRYRRVRSVRLHFADLSPQPVAGRPQASYRNDRDLSFPLALETPRPIRDGSLILRVKDAASLRVLAKRSVAVPSANTGRLDVTATLALDDVARLPLGRDLLIHVALVWRSRSGATLGTSVCQLITLVGEFSFDRVEQDTVLVPLNDVERYRDFWHKAWQGTFTRERRRISFNCRYQYALDADARDNAQMETVTAETEDKMGLRFASVARLSSGLVISLYRLNELAGRLGPSVALTEAELAALDTPAFTERFSQAARTQVRFGGRDGDSAALWVFPEVKLQDVVLQRADVVNDAGHVLRFVEHRVRFPMPALAHFIGVASQ